MIRYMTKARRGMRRYEGHRQRTARAIQRIRPLPGNGPNLWTASVQYGSLSAPTKRQLCLMLWHWHKPATPPLAHLTIAQGEAA